MGQSFCRNCGTQLIEGSKFCNNCGTPVVSNPNEPAINNTPIYNGQVVYVKPKIPGRGLGIASMVLGIIASVYAFSLCLSINITISEYEEQYGSFSRFIESSALEGFLAVCVFFTIMSILSVIFGYNSKTKGYRCGVSTSGLIMGSISTTAFVVTMIRLLSLIN